MPERNKVLLTSVCRPLGPKHGDGPSVGYELLFGQVTRAQGLFSPRANHIHFSLEYIAENLEAPTTVLQYPTRQELLRELRKGYDVIGVSFLLATFHRMKEVVALIRRHSPKSRIVLGGYGTVLSDEVLRPHGDSICREEGVGFMRRLLGEPEIPMPYRHPLIVSRLKIFGMEASRTGMVFAGLGCPNGCDFCCTSYFFKRKHIRLLPTGQDLYRIIERYQEIEPGMSVVVLDEDFLLNKKRAMEFRECVLKAGRAISVFVFSSIRAISQYTVQEILEMGIDGFWIGYEGTRSGFAKQQGRPVQELFKEFREHGISILASMIVGMPYQTPEIIQEELSGLLALRPSLCQFLIYGPTPGTPFYDRIMKEGLLHRDLADDRERYYRSCNGFKAMVRHSSMSPEQIESAQDYCFRQDFLRLGPSIYRSLETWLLGYLKLKDSLNSFLRRKAERFGFEIRKAYPVFLAGRVLGPTRKVRSWIAGLEKEIYGALGSPSWWERFQSVFMLLMAFWTSLLLRLNFFQHPRLIRHAYRQADSHPRLSRIRRALKPLGSRVHVEIRPENSLWVRLEGFMTAGEVQHMAGHLREALRRGKDRLVLDLGRLPHLEEEAAKLLAVCLKDYRNRIRLALPERFANPRAAAWLAVFALYR
ncbi:MAG: radical SAM protein [Elusimicrobia bacterium]|nr:radical SAM protein [Elusimicrobiota bacterium]